MPEKGFGNEGRFYSANDAGGQAPDRTDSSDSPEKSEQQESGNLLDQYIVDNNGKVVLCKLPPEVVRRVASDHGFRLELFGRINTPHIIDLGLGKEFGTVNNIDEALDRLEKDFRLLAPIKSVLDSLEQGGITSMDLTTLIQRISIEAGDSKSAFSFITHSGSVSCGVGVRSVGFDRNFFVDGFPADKLKDCQSEISSLKQVYLPTLGIKHFTPLISKKLIRFNRGENLSHEINSDTIQVIQNGSSDHFFETIVDGMFYGEPGAVELAELRKKTIAVLENGIPFATRLVEVFQKVIDVLESYKTDSPQTPTQ